MNNAVNAVIRTLIISDFFLFFAIGLLSPIFAVFILENIEDSIEVAGYAVACYWMTRVVMVMPLSRLMDAVKGELDEYAFMVAGTLLIAVVPLLYLVSAEPWHIYLIQVLNGLAHSMAVPAWRILFTNHVDKKIIGFEWSLQDVGVGIATASSAAIGATIADVFGFRALFYCMSFVGLLSASILLTIGNGEKSMLDVLVRNKSRAPLKLDTFK